MKRSCVGVNDPSLKHVNSTNGVINQSMGIKCTDNNILKEESNSVTFGFDTLTKANATIARDNSISENCTEECNK